MPYHIRDPKRDRNLDNHPYACKQGGITKPLHRVMRICGVLDMTALLHVLSAAKGGPQNGGRNQATTSRGQDPMIQSVCHGDVLVDARGDVQASLKAWHPRSSGTLCSPCCTSSLALLVVVHVRCLRRSCSFTLSLC